MPVHKEKGGYQYGRSGKVYKGSEAKEKATKQGIAIKLSQMREAGEKVAAPKSKKMHKKEK